MDVRRSAASYVPGRSIHYGESAAGPPEPRVHNVVEDRAEAVAEAELDEVIVGRLELTTAEQPLLIAQVPAREVELVAEKGDLPERKERESLEQPQIEGVEENEVLLGEIVDVGRPFERAADRSPCLFHVDRSGQHLVATDFADLVEDGGVLVPEEVDAWRVL